MVKYTEEKVLEMIKQDYDGKRILILAPWCVAARDITGNCLRACGARDTCTQEWTAR